MAHRGDTCLAQSDYSLASPQSMPGTRHEQPNNRATARRSGLTKTAHEGARVRCSVRLEGRIAPEILDHLPEAVHVLPDARGIARRVQERLALADGLRERTFCRQRRRTCSSGQSRSGRRTSGRGPTVRPETTKVVPVETAPTSTAPEEDWPDDASADDGGADPVHPARHT
jgi:hypothetical protein